LQKLGEEEVDWWEEEDDWEEGDEDEGRYVRPKGD
jgi:hypothetical protein